MSIPSYGTPQCRAVRIPVMSEPEQTRSLVVGTIPRNPSAPTARRIARRNVRSGSSSVFAFRWRLSALSLPTPTVMYARRPVDDSIWTTRHCRDETSDHDDFGGDAAALPDAIGRHSRQTLCFGFSVQLVDFLLMTPAVVAPISCYRSGRRSSRRLQSRKSSRC